MRFIVFVVLALVASGAPVAALDSQPFTFVLVAPPTAPPEGLAVRVEHLEDGSWTVEAFEAEASRTPGAPGPTPLAPAYAPDACDTVAAGSGAACSGKRFVATGWDSLGFVGVGAFVSPPSSVRTALAGPGASPRPEVSCEFRSVGVILGAPAIGGTCTANRGLSMDSWTLQGTQSAGNVGSFVHYVLARGPPR